MNIIAPSAEPYSIKVLDKGFVTLEDSMGGDLRVVNAAKVSNGKRSQEVGEGEEKLINYLMKHHHTSPFEHVMFTFYVKAPIFVFREWHRHRTWKFNEISGRYVIFDPEFYMPEEFRVPAATNKQGSAFPTEIPPQTEKYFSTIAGWNQWAAFELEQANERSYQHYKNLIDMGVAKEMARMVLPVNLYSEMFGTIDAHNLMKFLSLRNAPDAQWEFQQYAKAIDIMLQEHMPVTYKAFKEIGL